MNTTFKIIITASVFIGIYSCAKKSSSASPTTTPTIQTNPNTYFTVDGVPANNPNSAGNANASTLTYVVFAEDNSGYPQVTITFPHTTIPTGGTYSIVTTNPATGAGLRCNFILTEIGGNVASASSGTVSITTVSTHSYEVVFNSITCVGSLAGTHVVSGTIGY
jgi:hypothetical protein